MDISLIYSKDDPAQTAARDFVRRFVQDKGILAEIAETNQPVESPTVIINGEVFKDMRRKPRTDNPRMYPAIVDIARAIEQHMWELS